MITNAGSGYSRWNDLAVTRWREDATCDPWGSFCYLRDTETGTFWSSTQPAHALEARLLRGHLHRGPRRVSPPRPGHRRLHRDRRLARGRHRSAPPAPDQPRPHAAQHRAHQLHRGRAGAARGRCAAPGVQQAVRADRTGRRPARTAVHAPPTLARGAGAVDVPPDGGARRHGEPGVARDRPRALHRARTHARRTAGDERGRGLVRHCRLGARPDRCHPTRRHAGAGADRHRRHRLRHGRSRATAAWRCLPSTPTGASPTACSNSRGRTAKSCCANSTRAKPTPSCMRGWPAPSIYSQPTLRADCSLLLRNRRSQSGLWGYAHLGRPADRAAADRRRRQHRTGAADGAGPRLVATEGSGGRPGDLERGTRPLPPALARADPRAHRGRCRGARGRPAGWHLRAPRGADLERRPRAAAGGGARARHRPPRHAGAAGAAQAGG